VHILWQHVEFHGFMTCWERHWPMAFTPRGFWSVFPKAPHIKHGLLDVRLSTQKERCHHNLGSYFDFAQVVLFVSRWHFGYVTIYKRKHHMYNFIDNELCCCNFYNMSDDTQVIEICWIANGCGMQMVIVT
jgi:hypothetical protein